MKTRKSRTGRVVILASSSKKRALILQECGIEHEVLSCPVREDRLMRPVTKLVLSNARKKSEAVRSRYSEAVAGSIVISADTLSECRGRILGKPSTEEEARRMLDIFNGRRIAVHTGVMVVDTVSGRAASGTEKSFVQMCPLDRKARDRIFGYIGPHDKAGGFSVEGRGALIFDQIHGSYYNILGLPLMLLKDLLARTGNDILDLMPGQKKNRHA